MKIKLFINSRSLFLVILLAIVNYSNADQSQDILHSYNEMILYREASYSLGIRIKQNKDLREISLKSQELSLSVDDLLKKNENYYYIIMLSGNKDVKSIRNLALIIQSLNLLSSYLLNINNYLLTKDKYFLSLMKGTSVLIDSTVDQIKTLKNTDTHKY